MKGREGMADKENPVSWFEIPVNDLERAVKFYQSLFGVELNQMEMGPTKMATFSWTESVPGAAGGLVKGDGYKPSRSGSVVYFTVEDVEAALAKAKSLGGKILMPKTGIGEWGSIGHFQDCEGNRVAFWSKK